jgi:acyl-CoA thioester hydrolase
MSGPEKSGETGTRTAAAGRKPLYVLRSTVWFDELDMLGVLHNARYAIHVERAMTAFYHSLPGLDAADDNVVVKQYEIEFLRPFTQEGGELIVEIGLGRLGNTSAVYTFRCLSEAEDGTEIEHARGSRTIVKVTRRDLRPAAWSDHLRALVHEAAS